MKNLIGLKIYIFPICILLLCVSSCKKEETDPDTPQTPTEALFARSMTSVFESPLDLAADPSLIRIGDSLMMYYTAENKAIGIVISTGNGDTWNSPDGNNATDYAALRADSTKWDETLETVDVLRVRNEYWMYYAGYIEGNDDNGGIVNNYEIGLAISTNGVDFIRHPQSVNQPILSRDTSNVDTDDRHAMTSPGVVYDNGTFYMIYAGWNVHNNWTGTNAGIKILGATSTDGINWSKNNDPLIISSEITYSPDINEASLLKSDDGFWYIPFSTGSSIGIARATSFFGPYDIYQKEIVSPEFSWDSEVTAPDGLIENGKMKLWYHGVKAPAFWPWVIGYSEANYPLNW